MAPDIAHRIPKAHLCESGASGANSHFQPSLSPTTSNEAIANILLPVVVTRMQDAFIVVIVIKEMREIPRLKLIPFHNFNLRSLISGLRGYIGFYSVVVMALGFSQADASGNVTARMGIITFLI